MRLGRVAGGGGGLLHIPGPQSAVLDGLDCRGRDLVLRRRSRVSHACHGRRSPLFGLGTEEGRWHYSELFGVFRIPTSHWLETTIKGQGSMAKKLRRRRGRVYVFFLLSGFHNRTRRKQNKSKIEQEDVYGSGGRRHCCRPSPLVHTRSYFSSSSQRRRRPVNSRRQAHARYGRVRHPDGDQGSKIGCPVQACSVARRPHAG